jgi:hypothetical protein
MLIRRDDHLGQHGGHFILGRSEELELVSRRRTGDLEELGFHDLRPVRQQACAQNFKSASSLQKDYRPPLSFDCLL